MERTNQKLILKMVGAIIRERKEKNINQDKCGGAGKRQNP